jgi:hypothetical protein
MKARKQNKPTGNETRGTLIKGETKSGYGLKDPSTLPMPVNRPLLIQQSVIPDDQ